MNRRALSPNMLRELRTIISTGDVSDAAEWTHCGALWFVTRDRCIGALLARGLIESTDGGSYQATDAGLLFSAVLPAAVAA